MANIFVAGIDSDGHFMIADANNRSKVYKLLERLRDGDFLKNLQLWGVVVPSEQEFVSMGIAEYYGFMAQIQAKGLFELVMEQQ